MPLDLQALLPRVDAYLAAHRERFLQELETLLAIPSVTTDTAAISEYVRVIGAHLQKIGLSSRTFETTGNPMILGEYNPGQACAGVLLYGHYDVMPAGNAADWTSAPFKAARRNGRIFARGAADNKGQHFAHLKAIEALVACDLPMPRTLLLLEGEEEIGSPTLPDFLADHRSELTADLCYGADGQRHSDNSPTIFLGCRGVLGVELTMQGTGSDLHSGTYGNVVDNPAWRLIRALGSMRDEAGRVNIEGFYEAVRAPTKEDIALIDNLSFDSSVFAAEIGKTDIPAQSAREHFLNIMFRPTFNLSALSAGDQGPKIKTAIPGIAGAKIDIRLVLDQRPEDIEAKIRLHLRKLGFDDVQVKIHNVMAPARTITTHPAVELVEKAIATAAGRAPVIYPALGASVPMFAFHEVLQMPNVWTAYAGPDQRAHAPDENVEIDCFFEGIRSTAMLLLSMTEFRLGSYLAR